jgi:hypothetical protein
MRRDVQARKMRTMVKKLARAHVDDVNSVLDRLDTVRRSQILSLLAATGNPRWRERLPKPQPKPQAPQKTEAPLATSPANPPARDPDPRWLAERTDLRDGAQHAADFFQITPAALDALRSAKLNLSTNPAKHP